MRSFFREIVSDLPQFLVLLLVLAALVGLLFLDGRTH